MNTTAFGITAEDVCTVLELSADNVVDANARTVEMIAEDLFNELAASEFGRIEEAALNSGVELAEQLDGAYAEIRVILVERGILKA